MAIKKDKLSLDQKAELERLRPFIARQGLVSQMNGGAWRAALDAILGVPDFVPLYRVRCVRDVADPPVTAWQGPLPAGLPLYNFIEWLELNPKVPGARDFTTDLKLALQSARTPFVVQGTAIRIMGYRRMV